MRTYIHRPLSLIAIADIILASLGPVLAFWLGGYLLFQTKGFSATETEFYVTTAAAALLVGGSVGVVVHRLRARLFAPIASPSALMSAATFAVEVLFCTAGVQLTGAGAYTLHPLFCLVGPLIWTLGAVTPIMALGGFSSVRAYLRPSA